MDKDAEGAEDTGPLDDAGRMTAHDGDRPTVESARIRVERAVAELRFGRPVVLVSPSGPDLAMIALDTATPSGYDRFAALSDHTHALYLTPERASVLGLAAPAGCCVPLADRDHSEACHLGYLRTGVAAEACSQAPPAAAEAARLARVALLLPCVVVAAVSEATPERFDDCVRIETGDVALSDSLVKNRFDVVAEAQVPLKDIAAARFVVFRGGLAQRDQVAIVVGEIDVAGIVPVRVHSSCITGDLFGSLKCDCGDQLREGLRTLEAKGGGILLYLDQEGRGTGIAAKMRAYGLQADGLDTVEADATLGFGSDERRYETAAAMLDGLNVRRIDLLTNNPMKIAYLRACGIEVVDRTPVYGTPTPENEGYLRVKAAKSGHLIDLDALFGGPAGE